jgi:hypothetical protein
MAFFCRFFAEKHGPEAAFCGRSAENLFTAQKIIIHKAKKLPSFRNYFRSGG